MGILIAFACLAGYLTVGIVVMALMLLWLNIRVRNIDILRGDLCLWAWPLAVPAVFVYYMLHKHHCRQEAKRRGF